MTNCLSCGGSGWTIVERKGVSAAERCACSKIATMPRPRPTLEEITVVLGKIAQSDVIPFFPKTEDGWIIMAAEISSFVEDRQGLDLLARMMVRHLKKYEGVAGLRQVYCAYRTPADGIYPNEPLPGFGLEEQEARYQIIEIDENTRRMEEYRAQAALAPPEDRAPFELPEAKLLPAPSPHSSQSAAAPKPARFRILPDGKIYFPTLKELEAELASAPRVYPERTLEERQRLAREIQARLTPKKVPTVTTNGNGVHV